MHPWNCCDSAILSPILNGLHLWDPWLRCEVLGSNRDKISRLLFLLLSPFIHPSFPPPVSFHSSILSSSCLLSFIHPSLPSHIKTPSALGLIFCLFMVHIKKKKSNILYQTKCEHCFRRIVPYKVKMQYVQISNIKDTSISIQF